MKTARSEFRARCKAASFTMSAPRYVVPAPARPTLARRLFWGLLGALTMLGLVSFCLFMVGAVLTIAAGS